MMDMVGSRDIHQFHALPLSCQISNDEADVLPAASTNVENDILGRSKCPYRILPFCPIMILAATGKPAAPQATLQADGAQKGQHHTRGIGQCSRYRSRLVYRAGRLLRKWVELEGLWMEHLLVNKHGGRMAVLE